MPPDPFFRSTSFGTIRAARPQDCADILRMARRLARHHQDACGLTTEHIVPDVFCHPRWLHLLVAERQAKPIGYAVLFGTAQFQFGRRGMELHHLFTEKHMRGQGVGQALVEACLTFASGLSCDYLTVGTDPDNLAAQGFYLRFGFQRRPSFPPRFVFHLDGRVAGPGISER